jgi:hypothetical protein
MSLLAQPASALRLVALLLALPVPTLAQPQPATLRIGLWTLWRDQQVTLAPAPDGAATLRTCPACIPAPLSRPTPLRASGNRLALPDGRSAASVWLAGPVSLAAHGERLTLRHPLRIAARNGTLVMAATLPVETYVERVVASESGSADTAESLKALSVVVRSFALHQSHGHLDYDLCDSTHCQLLRWTGPPGSENGARHAAVHAATWQPPARPCGSTASAPPPGSIKTAAAAPHRLRSSGPPNRIGTPPPGLSRAPTTTAQPAAPGGGLPACHLLI